MENILKGLDLSDEELTALEAVLDVPPEEVDAAIEQAKSILQDVLVNKSDDAVGEFVEAFLAEKATEEIEETPVDYVEFRSQVMEDLNVSGLQEALQTLNNRLTSIEGVVENLGAEVKAVKVDEDTKIANAFAPAFNPAPNWNSIVSGKQADEEEELLETLKGNIPEYKETETGKENPLEIGFTKLLWGNAQ